MSTGNRGRTFLAWSHGVATALWLASAATPAGACPMCKEGATIDPATSPTATPVPPDAAGLDFNTSIYLMLGVVAVVGTTAGRAMAKAIRR